MNKLQCIKTGADVLIDGEFYHGDLFSDGVVFVLNTRGCEEPSYSDQAVNLIMNSGIKVGTTWICYHQHSSNFSYDHKAKEDLQK